MEKESKIKILSPDDALDKFMKWFDFRKNWLLLL